MYHKESLGVWECSSNMSRFNWSTGRSFKVSIGCWWESELWMAVHFDNDCLC